MTLPLTILLLLISSLTMSHALAQQSDLDAAQEELEQSELLVDELSFSYGRLDRRMLEPLDRLSKQMETAGRFDEANQILDQTIQIVRLSEGLYTPAQVPVLLRKIGNLTNLQDWAEARSVMEHLDSLLERPGNEINEELIHSLSQLADFHLRGVGEDAALMQGYHFRMAARITRLSYNSAVLYRGEYDPSLPALMYKIVLQHYLQALAVDIGGRTSLALRAISYQGPMFSRSRARFNNYYSGLWWLNQIRNIYLNQEQPMLEALGLADMYIGDWQVLFAKSEAASRAYLRSNQGLRMAGIEQRAINQFFSSPTMLPVNHFYSSWSASASSESSQSVADHLPEAGLQFSFKQWSPNFPHVQSPFTLQSGSNQETSEDEFLTLSFSLTGLEEVARWHRGRYRASVSVARDIDWLSRSISTPIDPLELEESIREIRFRPKLVDGNAQTVKATLRYQLAEAQ